MPDYTEVGLRNDPVPIALMAVLMVVAIVVGVFA